jgi:hypothetical protein
VGTELSSLEENPEVRLGLDGPMSGTVVLVVEEVKNSRTGGGN